VFNKLILAAAGFAALAGCAPLEPAAPPATAPAAPIRFLLSFDDGPAPSTAKVLDALAANPVQPGVKAIFFVQTGVAGIEGREMMRRTHAEGHLLAVHTGTARGHVSHMALSREELEASLRQAQADIADIAGAAPRFVRPPFWFYDDEALASYARVDLAMLLTDVNALDGQVLGVNLVPAKRMIIRAQLERIKQAWRQGALPVLDGATPIVATFHDVNTGTAATLADYLQLLVEESRALGLTLAGRPFYDRRADLERAAEVRARRL
jgi:peptidoglycan/xylan/chitin deacetylase (PgdA/CDA1 family)